MEQSMQRWTNLELITAIRDWIESGPTPLGTDLGQGVIEPLGAGNSHLNFLAHSSTGKCVFRIRVGTADPTLSAAKTQDEFNSLRVLAPYGVAPKALALDTSCHILPMPLLVIEYIEGEVLSARAYRYDDSFISQLAEAVRSVHNLPIAPLLQPAGYLEGLSGGIAYLRTHLGSEELAEMIDFSFVRLERELTQFDLDLRVPSHGNIWERNVISDGTRFRLIDFESLAMRDPALEIAHIWTDFNDGGAFTDAEARCFIHYYGEQSDPALLERAQAYMPMEALSGLVRRMLFVIKLQRREVSRILLDRVKVAEEAGAVVRLVTRAIDLGVLNRRCGSIDVASILLGGADASRKHPL